MKVGYVLRYFPASSETFVAREILGLLRRGVEVDVAALGARDAADRSLVPEVPVFRAPSGWRRPTPRRWTDLRLLTWQRPKDMSRGPWLRGLARSRGWDHVHVHFAGEALEVAVAAGLDVPVSVTVHAVDLFRPRASLLSLLHAARVVTVCEHHRAWLRARYGVEAVVVRCGAPIDVPMADPSGEGLRVVSVARDVPKKGLDILVDALPPGARLDLISDATRLASDRVTVRSLPPSEVADALAAAQLFALPCRVAPDGDRDGVPVALMEAMAAGLPVVSTGVSGVPELVDDQVGWRVPADDADALRHALREAMGDPEARVRRGRAGRERVRRGWTVDQQVEGLLAVILAERARRP